MTVFWTMTQQVMEGSTLVAARATFGDEAVAEMVFNQEFDAGFVDRHPRQLGGLMTSYVEAQT